MFKDSEKFFVNNQGKICYKKMDSTYLFALKNRLDLDTRFYMENQLVYIITKKTPIEKYNFKVYEQLCPVGASLSDSDFDYECDYISKKRTKLNKQEYKQKSDRKYIKKIISKKRNNARKNKINDFIYNTDQSIYNTNDLIDNYHYSYSYIYRYSDYYSNKYNPYICCVYCNNYWKYPLLLTIDPYYSHFL